MQYVISVKFKVELGESVTPEIKQQIANEVIEQWSAMGLKVISVEVQEPA